MTFKVLVIGPAIYARVFDNMEGVEPLILDTRDAPNMGDNALELLVAGLAEECDGILFTGGADVSPKLYGQDVHPETSYDEGRDRVEIKLFNAFHAKSRTMFGICRGSQFLCVANGGSLIQDVTHHALHGTHAMVIDPKLIDLTADLGHRRVIQVTSTHHQMACPHTMMNKKGFHVLGMAPGLSTHYQGSSEDDDRSDDVKRECEIVLYPESKALGMQYHPEYMDINSDGFKFTQKLIKKHIEGELVKLYA